MSSLSAALGLLGLGLMVVLVSRLTRHKLYYVFPAFFAYCVFVIVAVVIEAALGKSLAYSFWAYWLNQCVYVVLALVAMLSVLRPYTDHFYVRHPWSKLVFVPLLVVIVGLGLCNAIFNPINRTSAGRFASGIYVFVILMSLAELGLFVVSWRAKPSDFLYWREQVFAVLLGFGVLSFIKLLAYTALILRILHLRVTPALENVFQLVPSGAFIASTAIWLLEFWSPKDLKEPPDFGKMRDALRVMQEQLDADLEIVTKIARRLGIKVSAAWQS